MPAAAVIPAPITYTKVVVKKLVVGFQGSTVAQPQGMLLAMLFFGKTMWALN